MEDIQRLIRFLKERLWFNGKIEPKEGACNAGIVVERDGRNDKWKEEGPEWR